MKPIITSSYFKAEFVRDVKNIRSFMDLFFLMPVDVRGKALILQRKLYVDFQRRLSNELSGSDRGDLRHVLEKMETALTANARRASETQHSCW